MNYGSKIFVCRKNSIRADEPADLKYQGKEGGKINAAQSTKKKPSRHHAIARTLLPVK
jgi:hypothetical protein